MKGRDERESEKEMGIFSHRLLQRQETRRRRRKRALKEMTRKRCIVEREEEMSSQEDEERERLFFPSSIVETPAQSLQSLRLWFLESVSCLLEADIFRRQPTMSDRHPCIPVILSFSSPFEHNEKRGERERERESHPSLDKEDDIVGDEDEQSCLLT
jgi:hypothetical protein